MADVKTECKTCGVEFSLPMDIAPDNWDKLLIGEGNTVKCPNGHTNGFSKKDLWLDT